MKIRDRLNLRLISKKKITNPTFIIGFQGVGLVGTMAAQHLADTLKCELIGHIESEYLPPIAILHDDKITFPIRIYYNKKHNLIIISSEVPITGEFAFEMSHDIADLMKKYKAKQVFVLEGLVSKIGKTNNKEKIFGVPTDEKMKKFLLKNNIKIIKNGAILGVAGSMLLTGIEYNVSSCTLMAESHVDIPDALAASRVLNKLGSVLGFKINISKLEKRGDVIEKKIKDIMKTMKTYKSNNNAKTLYG